MIRRLQLLFRVLGMLNLILRDTARADRWQVFRAYLRISFKFLVVEKLFRRQLRSERFLGYRVRFFRYGTFKYLFEEIFIEQQYRFAAASQQPFILDCGSNIGMAVLFFKRYYPTATIIGFEPDAETFAALRGNVEENRLEGVTLVQKAVSERAGTLTFYYDPQSPGGLCMSTQKARLPDKGEQTVEAVPLSTFVTQAVDFLKLDVEGAEEDVLRDLVASGALKSVRQMVVEYHHHIHPDRDALSEFLATLEQQGFGYQLSASQQHLRARQSQDILILAYPNAAKGTLAALS
jgi:FkbM family methyltransferase